MEKRFSIKSKYFSLYQAFRVEAEKVGWVYNSDFNEFEEERMDYSNCLFFHTYWKHEGRNPLFSFSNSDTNVFHLPEQWNEAVDYMTRLFNDGLPKKEKAKVAISLKDLAEHHGVGVDDIIITS